jgi:hypothetical protein
MSLADTVIQCPENPPEDVTLDLAEPMSFRWLASL